MTYVIGACRRRWARSGRALADFIFSFFVAALSHVLAGAYGVGCWIARRFVALVRHRRLQVPKPAPDRRMVLCATAESATHVDFRPIAEKPNVRFADIAGLEDAKQEIRLRMILPVLYPAKARHFGIRQGGGLLLYGPPGTGKTMLAKAVATEVDAAFYSVRPSDIMSAAVGQAEANVDRLFQTLRQHKRAVLFLDEVEALIPSRRRNGSTIMRRLVSQILGAADGLAKAPDGHVLLLIGATNEPDMIDPAMLRPGRFDAKIFVGLPDRHARRQILATHLVDHPLGTDVRIDCIADQTEGLSGAELAGLVDTAADSAFLRSVALDSAECVIAATDFAPQRAIGTPNSLGASLSCLPIPRSINRA